MDSRWPERSSVCSGGSGGTPLPQGGREGAREGETADETQKLKTKQISEVHQWGQDAVTPSWDR